MSFWRSSRLQIYEREYDGFITFISNIGGPIQLIYVCSIIGIYFSEYAELIDSEKLYKDITNNIKEKSKIKNNMIKNKEYNKLVLKNNVIDSKVNSDKEGQFSSIKVFDIPKDKLKSRNNKKKA